MNDIRTALFLANLLYNVDIDDDEFEELALIAWNRIGNKHTRLYKYRAVPDENNSIILPCNCDLIEAVTFGYEDPQLSSNTHEFGDYDKFLTEEYIERHKHYKDPYYLSGKYVKYTRSGNTLYFDKHYGPINILYHGIIMGDDDLPMVNDKEVDAIAAFCAYTQLYKKGLSTMNLNLITLANLIKMEWNVKCDNARTPEYIDLNEMNEILDAKTSWNRKVFNKSYKPIQ